MKEVIQEVYAWFMLYNNILLCNNVIILYREDLI